MLADEYFAVGLELNAAIFMGGGHALEVGIGDTVLRHKIVNVHVNHLSKPRSLSVLPLGGIIPCHKIETIIHGIIDAQTRWACRASPRSRELLFLTPLPLDPFLDTEAGEGIS